MFADGGSRGSDDPLPDQEIQSMFDSREDGGNNAGASSGIIYPLELEIDNDSFDQPLLPISEDSMTSSSTESVQLMVYPQRWTQLFYLSMLALLSDWICFSTAAAPDAFQKAYGHSSASLIDIFLFMNVASCLFVTDVVAKFGLQKSVQAASALMTLGCWLRSGFGIVRCIANILGLHPAFLDDDSFFGLVSYPLLVIGTLMVGAAQPYFQCTPPLLSAQWFASNERATSTAVALNFNQIGIATAFLVGGQMATSAEGIEKYFALIAVLCTLFSIGTFVQFKSRPPSPPSASELEKIRRGQREPPFIASVKSLFGTPGFTRPLAAFICSITITNIIGTFINEIMERGGVTNRLHIALAGSGFETTILVGGIILGSYVDRTKAYKKVTLGCLVASIIFLIPLGLTYHTLGKVPVLLVLSLLGLGFFAGPIQPINAELAVDVAYPGDETAVESVQQIGGNLVSALLVPLAERGSRLDYQLLPNVSFLSADIRGDVILLVVMSIATYCFFSGLDAPLKRTIADQTKDR